MVRSLIKQSLIKQLNEFIDPIFIDGRTFIEVDGNDVTFFNYITNHWTTVEDHPYHYADIAVSNMVASYEAEERGLREEYNDLVHELKWCFNPVREWKIYGRLKELKIQLADRQTSEQYRRELEEKTWYEKTRVQHQESFYRPMMIWHVDCNCQPTFEMLDSDLKLSNLDHLDIHEVELNWSIVVAMMTEPMDKKIRNVQAVIESCQKNHHDKGNWKVFLDAARGGKQLKLVDSTFEALLTL